MTTREFIKNVVSGQTAKRQCSSVFTDGNHIYSYGYHYPLLVNVAGKWILNDRGYSNTTARHIYWASDCADFKMHISGGQPQYGGMGESSKALAASLYKECMAQMDEIVKKLNNLSARAFRQREILNSRRHELVKTANFLRTAAQS